MIKISVVCPVFNSSHFIEKTLEAIVNQSFLPYEVLISDDGSQDTTLQVIKHFVGNRGGNLTWHIIENKHKGPGAARNSGINKASGDWIAFLDSDDLWAKNKIERITQAIISYQQMNFFCNDELLVRKNGNVKLLTYGRNYNKKFNLQPQLYLANMFSTSAVTCQRDLLVKHGYFDESLMSAQDYELWLRLSPFIKLKFVNEVLGKYIERDGNITSSGLVRRFINEIRIAFIHRKLVSNTLVFIRLIRIIMSYIRQFIRYKISI